MHLSIPSMILGVVGVFSFPFFAVAEEVGIVMNIETEIGQPIHLTALEPTTIPLVGEDGRFLVSSITSYDIVEKNLSACSFIARNNIALLLESMNHAPDDIVRGDANDLIRSGRIHESLTSFAKKDALLAALTERHNHSIETVFDVYRFVGRRPVGLQGHRVAVFLGDDNQWYILDPLDGKKTREPQLFSDFLANDIDDAEWLVRFPGYSMMNLVTDAEFAQVLPYFSAELRIFFHTYHLNMPMLARGTSSSPPLTL